MCFLVVARRVVNVAQALVRLAGLSMNKRRPHDYSVDPAEVDPDLLPVPGGHPGMSLACLIDSRLQRWGPGWSDS